MLELISTGIDIAKSVMDLAAGPIRRRRMRGTLIRLLYLEIAANLELFTTVGGKEAIRNLARTDASARWIVERLSTKILEMILLGDYHVFKVVKLLADKEDSIEDDDGVSYLPDTSYRILKYLAIQISFLRAFLASPDCDFPVATKVGLRLERVFSLFRTVAGMMRDSKEIRPFVRDQGKGA
ncbi:MAG: hypothetical protein WCQ50_13130 [Spirochaetota bacterium]